ncbi:hypothetical protein F53441_9553 [Fusarium austroafricanum]|uniref:BZIP domain-containing protein n=1 Tax=Fusarium austroafricanum TaxID=2364996 RepID=A0A8H4NQ33_9HYPO|nr:hypothetical protein F53441_9553 [Fusarium austroafricanum]
MGATEPQDDLSRRRERGRRSQAAFRKRQAQSTQALAAQNNRLKQGIQRALDAAHGDERPELLSTLRELAAGAGLDVPANISQERTPSSDYETMAIGTTFTGMPLPVASSQSTHYRLDCSMWLDPLHYLRASLPPQDILPYLGSGAESFAGLLFWSVMEHSQTRCAQHYTEGLSHSKATKDIKPSFVKTMATARVEYKQTGSISQEHAVAAEKDLGLVLCSLIEAEYRSEGKNPNQWLSCLAIEHRIGKAVGESALGALRRAALGQGSPTLQKLLEDVKCRLCDSAVCFGDGPRWNIDVVARLFAPVILHTLEITTP